MNKSIDILKTIYKPYRITIKGEATILETTSGTYVVKKKENSINELYTYLRSRNFEYFPNLVDSSRDEVNVFEYIDDVKMPKDQKAHDLIQIIGLLHNKTSYFKEVTSDTYKEIYENILANISHLKKYYSDLFDVFILNEYLSPSAYLFLRNYYEIDSCLRFCKTEIERWFLLVQDKTKQRVSLVHNNLELNHFMKNEKDYLISWDKALIDSPILDIIHLYKKEYYNVEFSTLLSSYFDRFELNEDERILLFVCISLPEEIHFGNNEFENCDVVRKQLDYLFKTEELLKPYYSKTEEKE